MAVVLLFSGVGITLLTNNFGSGGNDAGAAVIYDTTDSLGRLPNGTSYMFTDRTKVDAFRAGTIDKDTTVIKVNSAASHGSQENPYAIANYDDWEKFVKLCANNFNNSKNKYFILTNDIDFSGLTFHPVAMFAGTFYGGDYSLLNISCSDWEYFNGTSYIKIGTTCATNDGYGVFCYVQNAVITDLVVDNFALDRKSVV